VATDELRQGEVPANGVTFATLEAGPEDGPLVLCLHGFPDTAWTWRYLLPDLGAAGFRAVAPFMRGYAPTSLQVKFTVKTDVRNITAFRLELMTDPNLPLGGPGRSSKRQHTSQAVVLCGCLDDADFCVCE